MADDIAPPAVRLPPVSLPSMSLGRKEAVVALLLLAGLLSWLLDPTLPGTILANILGTPSFTQASAVVPSGPLAPFDGWRIAYIGEDGRLYIVTQDGLTTLVGPQLPGLLPGGAFVASASPDGHHVAYASSASGINLIDLSGAPAKPVVHAFPALGIPLFSPPVWTTDGSRLAVMTSHSQLALLDVTSGRLTTLPALPQTTSLSQLATVRLLGWINSRSLALAIDEPDRVRIAEMDSISGKLHQLATLPTAGGHAGFALSPKGDKLLAYVDDGMRSTTAVWVVDTTTGDVQEQHEIVSSNGLNGPLVAVVWNQDGPTLVAATLRSYRLSNDSVHEFTTVDTWTLDISQDYAGEERPLYGIPLGWVPATGYLIYGEWNAQEGGSNSYVLLRSYFLSLRGTVTNRNIIGAADNLTFVGFVQVS